MIFHFLFYSSIFNRNLMIKKKKKKAEMRLGRKNVQLTMKISTFFTCFFFQEFSVGIDVPRIIFRESVIR